MKISYDVQALPERKRALGKRSEEVLALIAFLATPKKNMVIEYSGPDAEKECKKKYDTIRGYRLANKLADVFDVYRGAVPAQRNPLYVALYVALFPQLVAGPIVRYSTVEKEIGDFDLIRSPGLADEVKRCYERLTPLYRYILGMRE